MPNAQPMKPASVVSLVQRDLWPQWEQERTWLEWVDNWLHLKHERIMLPRSATREIKALRELARTPWLALVVAIRSQNTLVDGYRSPDAPASLAAGSGDAPAESPSSRTWRIWEANDFDARQTAIHRDAYTYGYSYATALPGQLPDGTPMPVLRPVSPRRMLAVYAEPENDDWPMFAMEVRRQPGGRHRLKVYDENFVYLLDHAGGVPTFDEYREHGAGVTPVVRYAHLIDSEGRCGHGGIAELIPTAERINKDDFDRLLAQHFTGWQVRYASGMAAPDSEEEANRKKLKLRQDDFLIAEDPDTKFGVLPGSPLDGLLKAKESDVETLSAVSQTPTHALTGTLINLSAEALAAARAQLDQMLAESKTSLGKSHGQLLRLGAGYLGDAEAAGDYMARVTWQDTSIRSLASAADALGKIAQQLQVPVRALWRLIPGVTKSDVDEWEQIAEGAADPLASLDAKLAAQAAALTGGNGGGGNAGGGL